MGTMILGLPRVACILYTMRSQKDFRQGSDTVHDQITWVALWKMDWREPDKEGSCYELYLEGPRSLKVLGDP